MLSDEDWLRTMAWDIRFPNGKIVDTMDGLRLVRKLYTDHDLEKFVLLPSWRAAPESLRSEVIAYLRSRSNVAAHLPGQHDQKSHGNWSGSGSTLTPSEARDANHLRETLSVMSGKNLGAKPRPGWKYINSMDLVAREGQAFKPPSSNDLPDDVRPGEPQECYKNAALTAISNPDKYTYVEGYATPKSIPLPIQHAWVVDADDNVIDNTWSELDGGTGAAYIGVKIDTPTLTAALEANEHYTLFQDWDSPVNPVRDGLEK